MAKDPQTLAEQSVDVANYESGARKPVPGISRRPDPVHTGDRGDEPKRPFGLTEPEEDRGDAMRHHDGQDGDVKPAG
jgi:hypothetical protein